jgi:hypothetical protein
MPDIKAFDPIRAEERERRRRTRDQRRNYFHRLSVDPASPFAAACHFLIPWDAHYYPGIGRGLRQLAGNRVGTETALKWRKGNPVPLWAMELVAEEIGRQARVGLKIQGALLAEIEAKKATPRKPRVSRSSTTRLDCRSIGIGLGRSGVLIGRFRRSTLRLRRRTHDFKRLPAGISPAKR